MSDAIRFLLNGVATEVRDLAPQTTLLEYLREARRLTGTKEGCAEGDCGACTVVLAERLHDGLAWKAVNACIRFLPSVDGKAVFTVESLRERGARNGEAGALHPCQQALVDCHGSQCGFCTPGFVMSLFALYKNTHCATRTQSMNALSGNLCRCTGYRPILEAAQKMYELPAPTDWRAPARMLADDAPAEHPVQHTSGERALLDALATLARSTPLDYQANGQRWIAPRTNDAVSDACAAHLGARLVAGATDVALWVTKQHRDIGDIVYLGDAADLAQIEIADAAIAIGATVSLEAAFAALCAEWPETTEVWERFASVPIRNSGTLVGNIANGSPIGDAIPVLIALNAVVELRSVRGTRSLPLEEFYLAYQKTARSDGEFLARVRIPRRQPGLHLRAYKISKRYDQDISAVFVCIALMTCDGLVASPRIGCGGVAPIPARAHETEAFLAGQRFEAAAFDAAAAQLADEFTPIADMRASANYRRLMLANLLKRFWLECGANASAPTRVDMVDIA